jgi:hypothetical protein
VEVAKNAEAPPATGAVPLSAVTLPVTVIVFPIVDTVVTAPVVLFLVITSKPPSDLTGPVKVVLAIRSSHAISVY